MCCFSRCGSSSRASDRVRRIAIWFRAPLSCGALSYSFFHSLVCWQSNRGGRSEVFLLWRGTMVAALRGLTLLPGTHPPTLGTNPLHADSRRSHHGRGTFGHPQVWWQRETRSCMVPVPLVSSLKETTTIRRPAPLKGFSKLRFFGVTPLHTVDFDAPQNKLDRAGLFPERKCCQHWQSSSVSPISQNLRRTVFPVGTGIEVAARES